MLRQTINGWGRAALAATLLLCAGLGAAPWARAQTTAPETIAMPAPVAATLSKLTGGQAKVLQTFKGPSGLIGIAISMGPGHDTIVYASPDGGYLFQGDIVDSNGQDMTQLAADSFLPKPPTAAQIFASLGQTHGYLWGQAGAKKELWIVFDPNCIFCHKTFDSLKGYVAKGALKVHIVQVGFLKPSSLGRAAAILGAADPVAALTQDETKFDVANEEGGIAPDLSNAAAVTQVKANNDWMNAQGIQGTPYMLYRNGAGKVRGVAGYVSDVKSLLADIGSAK